MNSCSKGNITLNHRAFTKLRKLEWRDYTMEIHRVIFCNLRHTKCHSHSRRIPRPLDHDHVWSLGLFRAVSRRDCVSRPGYANSRHRYGIKSRHQIRVYIQRGVHKIHTHTDKQIKEERRETSNKRISKSVSVVLLRRFDTGKILRIRRK